MQYKMEYISLGSDCSVAYQLQKLGIRNCAYPFDWIRTPNINCITDIISNNFDEYITSVTKICESSKFPLIDDKFNHNFANNNTIIMKNKYDVTFYHDFGINYIISDVSEKYNKRIQRFIEMLLSDRQICFIRYEKKYNNIKYDDILHFISAVKKINPNVKMRTIIIIHNPKNKCINIRLAKNDCIYIFNDTAHFDGWMRNNIDWHAVVKM